MDDPVKEILKHISSEELFRYLNVLLVEIQHRTDIERLNNEVEEPTVEQIKEMVDKFTWAHTVRKEKK